MNSLRSVQATVPPSPTMTVTFGRVSVMSTIRTSPDSSGINSAFSENNSTVIIGVPSGFCPTVRSVKVTAGKGRMRTLAEPPTRTGWPTMRVASRSKAVR